MLNDGISGDISDTQKDHLEIICKNLGRLSQLVNELVDISRSVVSPFSVKRIPVDIAEIVSDCIKSLMVKAKIKNIKLTSKIKNIPSDIYADPQRISQVLINLIDNAIKCTASDGKIDIVADIVTADGIKIKDDKAYKDLLNCAEGGKFLQVSVKDTGIGIPEDELENIFYKFYKIDTTDGGDNPGVGLGLSICKELIELHQGYIWVESLIKKGSQFKFVLPILSAKEALHQTVSDFIRKAKQEFRHILLVGVKVNNTQKFISTLGQEKTNLILKIFDKLLKTVTRRPDDFIMTYKSDVFMVMLYDSKRDGFDALKTRIEGLLLDKELAKACRDLQLELKFSSVFYPDDGIIKDELFEALSHGLGENLY